MKNLILLLSIGLLYASCTKEVLVEVPVTNPVNTQLQSQIAQLQNTISNLTTTNVNLESQISLLESEADILQGEIDAHLMTLEDAQETILGLIDIAEDLREDIENYNIEQERIQEEGFFRLNYSTGKSQGVVRVGNQVMTRIGIWDSALESFNTTAWFEESYALPDGKEVSYSTGGRFDGTPQLRVFYNAQGELILVNVSYAIYPDGSVIYESLEAGGNRAIVRDFYVEAFDNMYEFEDAVNEFFTLD